MRITLSTINKVYKAGRASVETMELKGYELIEELFVDSSGFGAPDEPALTGSQFDRELTALLKTHGELTAKLTGVGQFQVYVGLFKRISRGNTKRISTNVLERWEGSRKIVRLYDTDIVSIDDFSGAIELHNGGFQTRTTSKWINKYLPSRYSLYQKNWDWFIHDSEENREIPYEDGIILL